MPPDSFEHLHGLIEHSTDIITIIDEEGTITYESPATEQILGYEAGDRVGDDAFEYVHPDDRRRVVERFEDIVGSPGTTSDGSEYRFRHADGSWVWLESVTTNRTQTDVDGYVVNSRDISERKQRERELGEERQKYETVVEQSHDAIAIHQDGEVVFANQRCLEMLGYTEAELLGKSFQAIVAPEERERISEFYRQRIDANSDSPPRKYESVFLTSDGTRRIGELTVTTIQYEGEPAILVFVRDVTDRHHYQAQLEEVAEQLELLNRVVRHDIRNDMSIILGWLELLEPSVDADGQEHIQQILESGEHIVELTEIARDYVETLTSEGELELQPISVRSVLETEFALRRDSFPDASFTVAGDIPRVEVEANEMLGSVFRNLLNNAVQHNDTAEPAVELAVEEHAEVVVVRVADNGPGVRDDQKESVFGKDEKGLDSPGTGIGLYLVQTLVGQFGGEVWIEDNEPRGAVFAVQLSKCDRQD
jgi:PAS domain S-box-containing protein